MMRLTMTVAVLMALVVSRNILAGSATCGESCVDPDRRCEHNGCTVCWGSANGTGGVCGRSDGCGLACSGVGSCPDFEACSACIEGTCSPPSVCGGPCADPNGSDCADFVNDGPCPSCIGGKCQAPQKCGGNCTTPFQCGFGSNSSSGCSVCLDNQCSPGIPPGAACTSDYPVECSLEAPSCVNGVCRLVVCNARCYANETCNDGCLCHAGQDPGLCYNPFEAKMQSKSKKH